MERIKAVLFDQGNVLDSHREADRAIAAVLGFSFDDFSYYQKPHIRAFHLGLDELEYLRRICTAAGKNPPSSPIIKDIYDAVRPSNLRLLGVNRQLRERGLKTGILSNAERPLTVYLAEQYGPQPPFDTIVYSCDVGFAKPDREIYFYACNSLGIAPKDAVFIDDNARNVEAFRELGGYGIHHVEDQKTIKELSDILGYQFM